MNKNDIHHPRAGGGRQTVMLLFAALLSASAPSSSEVYAFQTLDTTNKLTRRAELQPTSITSLHLFGLNKKDDKEEPVDNEEEEKDETFMTKAISFSKVALPSFLTGGVVTLGFLFLPLVSDYYDAFNGASMDGSGSDMSGKVASNNNANRNNVNQPVLLFETILNDLNEAYVDDVDVQKLFETGVKAMTASLDPYTEFESRLEAQEMQEVVTGKYGGVGLVIRGGTNLKELEEDEIRLEEQSGNNNVEKIQSPGEASSNDKTKTIDTSAAPLSDAGSDKLEQKSRNSKSIGTEEEEDLDAVERKKARKKSMEEGIRVVSAFEGYAYDAGMRVGDKLVKITDVTSQGRDNEFDITPTTSVDDVRNHLRGDPGTSVEITFLREGVGGKVNEPQTITLERNVVRIPDVKYFGFVGDPSEGIGYIDLSGFANDAGREVRYAIRALQHGATELAAVKDSPRDESGMLAADPTSLKGLVLDLRSNPGGLLTSAVDVSTLLVPNGSDIVSAKGRGFPETLYRSKVDPILNPSTKLAVLVNEQTASAAEIVTGAVQDLDVGIVVGKGRTFGKGLVQNVQDLPYQTALKYTVAKYYTPSGRCIQSTVYEEGSSKDGENVGAKFKSTKVEDKDRQVFQTAHGRPVKDGGGVEVDYKVEPQKASPLELILLNSGAYSDFAAEWSKNNELTDSFKVDDKVYKEFQLFVEKKQSNGEIKMEVLYDSQLKELQKKLKASRFDSSRRELAKLKNDIIKETLKDFTTYKKEIKEDVEQNILARYLPDSMLIERGMKRDPQVIATAKMLKDDKVFSKLLARDLVEAESTIKAPDVGYETTSTTKPVPTLQSRW